MAPNKLRDCANCKECEVKSPLLRNLTEEDQAIMNQERFVVSYQPGELIFKQGSSFTHVIMIISGATKSYIEGANKNLILTISRPYDTLLGPGLFIDDKHHYSASALIQTEACYIAVNHFREVLRRNSFFAEEVVKQLSISSLFFFKRMMSLTQKQVPGRVAEALLYFSNDIYNSTSFDLNFSRQELAEYCGVTKESAIRVLKDLKEEGLIQVNGNNFNLIDSDKIRMISDLG